MISDNTTSPSIDRPVLTISQIIKNVMYSAAEAKLSGLFICAKAVVPPSTHSHRNGLASTPFARPVRKLHRHQRLQQNHGEQNAQVNGHAPLVAPLPLLPRPLPLLLGTRKPKPRQLPYKASPPPCTICPTGQLIQGKQLTPQLTDRVCCSLCPKTHRA